MTEIQVFEGDGVKHNYKKEDNVIFVDPITGKLMQSKDGSAYVDITAAVEKESTND